jgi:hypothetical protein
MRASALLVFMAFLVSQGLAAAEEAVPFQICGESATWTRPTPDVQAKVWNDPRYSGFARTDYAWTHHFVLILDPESTNEFGYISNLSGIWTAKPGEVVDKCSSDKVRRSGYEWIEVLSLLHRVKEVRRETNTYTVIVEPVDKGFQSVFIRRQNPSAVLRFVTPVGFELERWDESKPPKQFSNTVPPATRIIPPNGRVIQK